MSILINDFKAGWQNVARHEAIRDDALFLVDDLDFDTLGTLKCRKLNEEVPYFAGIGAPGSMSNLFVFDTETSGERLFFYTEDAALKCYNKLTKATRTVIDTTVDDVYYAAFKPVLSDKTHIYITDGATMVADDGTTTKTWGIVKPESAPRVSISTHGGNLSAGEYRYVYTFYDNKTGGESQPSNECSAITAVDNDSVKVTNIGISSDSRVTSRRLYRTLASGGTYYLATTINDNAMHEFIDDRADADLTVEATMDQDVPPKCRIVKKYKNMLLLTGDPEYPDRVYYCRSTRPDNWPSLNYVEVDNVDDAIMNIEEYGGTAYFIRSSGISRLYGETPDAFNVEDTPAHMGTSAAKSVAKGPGGIYRLTIDGVYRFNGRSDVRVSRPIDKCFGLDTCTATLPWWYIVDRATAPSVAIGRVLNGVYYLLVPIRYEDGDVANVIYIFDATVPSDEQYWRSHIMNLDYIAVHEHSNTLYGCDAGSVYTLLSSVTTEDFDAPSPLFLTKSYKIPKGREYGLSAKGGITATEEPAIDWVRKFRIDAVGDWALAFYIDDVPIHGASFTGLTAADRYKWHNFTPSRKGRFIYVLAIADGTKTPSTCMFNELEIV